MRLKTPATPKAVATERSRYPMPGGLSDRMFNQSLQSFWTANNLGPVRTDPTPAPEPGPQTMDVDSTNQTLFDNFKWLKICIPGFLQPLPESQRHVPVTPPKVTPPVASTSQAPAQRSPRKKSPLDRHDAEDREAAILQLQEMYPTRNFSPHEAEEQILTVMLRLAERRVVETSTRFQMAHTKRMRLRQSVPETFMRGGFKYVRVNRVLEDRRRALKVEEKALNMELMSRKNEVRRRTAALLKFKGYDPGREGTVDSDGSTPGPTDRPQSTIDSTTWNPPPVPPPREQWNFYETRWKTLLSSPEDEIIHLRDIAFPMPIQPTAPHEISREKVVAFLLAPRTPREVVRRRQRLRDALTRWRPDRFGSEILPRVDPKDAANVWEMVGVVAGILFDLLEQDD